jgi:hypothetical protein
LIVAFPQETVEHIIRDVAAINFYNASDVRSHFFYLHRYSLWKVQRLSPSRGRALQGLPAFVVAEQVEACGSSNGRSAFTARTL